MEGIVLPIKRIHIIAIQAAALTGVFCNAAGSDGKSSRAWSYQGKLGPKNWSELETQNTLCSKGVDQSPVNLSRPQDGEGDSLRFEYFASQLVILNNGHTIEFHTDKGSVFHNGKADFLLKQIHFHTPSEHTINGKSYPMEIHFVHGPSLASQAEGVGNANQSAVVSVMATLGERNPALDTLFTNIPKQGQKKSIPGIFINPASFLPHSKGYFYYPGSLTTPPCSEGVQWHVFKEPIQISKQQLQHYRTFFKNNARPLQPLRDRIVRHSN
jgi:carbonic anhydrase